LVATAQASSLLLDLEKQGRRRRWFEVQQYKVLVQDRGAGLPGDGPVEASVKVAVGGQVRHVVREGPEAVHALEKALREALGATYPGLGSVKCAGYSVRVRPQPSSTGAVRASLRMEDGEGNVWGTVGVARNCVAASFRALVDAFEYKLLLDAKKAGPR
jgi:2-isopropylmalate synthase